MSTDTEPTTALVVRDDAESLAPIPVEPPSRMLPTMDELNVIMTLARQVKKTAGLLPAAIKSEGEAFAIMYAGWELGAPPFVALREIFVVNGRTSPSAQLMIGTVQAKDPTAKFIWHEESENVCDLELQRLGREAVRLKYTMNDVKRAGLAGKAGPWQQYTRDMLRWFTAKRVCRLGAADLINALQGVSVRQADSMMDAYEPQARVIEAPALDGPALGGEVIAVENVASEASPDSAANAQANVARDGLTREAFDAWCDGYKVTDAHHACQILNWKSDRSLPGDPLQDWLDNAATLGLPEPQALATAQAIIKDVTAEWKKNKIGGLSAARAVVDPAGRVARAADEHAKANAPTAPEDSEVPAEG